MLVFQTERRVNFQHIFLAASRAHQDAMIEYAITDAGQGLFFRARGGRDRIAQRRWRGQRREPIPQFGTDPARVRL